MYKVILIAILTTFISINLFAESEAEIVFIKGKGTVIRKGQKINAKKGLKLYIKDVIESGAKSTLILKLDKGKYIKMKAESKFQIKNLNRGQIKLHLYEGGLFAKVNKLKSKEKFQIETISTLAGVRGTQFFVHTLKSKNVWLCVNEGKVQVDELKSKSSVLVEKGKGVHVLENKKIASPKKFKWTENLNWAMDSRKGNVEDKLNIQKIHDRWMKKMKK